MARCGSGCETPGSSAGCLSCRSRPSGQAWRPRRPIQLHTDGGDTSNPPQPDRWERIQSFHSESPRTDGGVELGRLADSEHLLLRYPFSSPQTPFPCFNGGGRKRGDGRKYSVCLLRPPQQCCLSFRFSNQQNRESFSELQSDPGKSESTETMRLILAGADFQPVRREECSSALANIRAPERACP